MNAVSKEMLIVVIVSKEARSDFVLLEEGHERHHVRIVALALRDRC